MSVKSALDIGLLWIGPNGEFRAADDRQGGEKGFRPREAVTGTDTDDGSPEEITGENALDQLEVANGATAGDVINHVVNTLDRVERASR